MKLNVLIFILFFAFFGCSSAQKIKMEADITNVVCPIQPTMYGVFFEDINFAADGGLYPELVKNRGFEFENPMEGWSQPKTERFTLNLESGFSSIIKQADKPSNRNYLHINVLNDQNYVLVNEGFRGMGIHSGKTYRLKANVSIQDHSIQKVKFDLQNALGKSIGSTTIMTDGDWQTYLGSITALETVEKAKLVISFTGKGELSMDMISLFPEDNWGKRENGLRKDLVQLLYDMKPGFLRFPGGCIVEGRTLAQRYQWKKTVGPVAERETLVNRWNTEFAHRPTPDYFQSFGLGFFEYFQLAEDIGAKPLPILSCGMACQFNTGELVPMDELDPYIQDALDLIEFANGTIDSQWGALRNEMGHAKPFNLQHIGVGNEQWGPEYFERYAAFEKAIKNKYPEINIVSGYGPFPDGPFFDYGVEQIKSTKADLVDEHYYKPPSWFRENADRYDNYDRKGPKIFAGEYAAQSVATVSPDNKNNWECALSEAAFMTGLERNAEVVHLTSYAPLMAHADAWQWTPDMIWFNNLTSYGTTNYYVQKMYANYAGTQLLKISSGGKKLIGQKEIFASMVKDERTNEIYIKVVNTSASPQELEIALQGSKITKGGEGIRLQSNNLQALNSFQNPTNISPKIFSFKVNSGLIVESVPGYSFSIFKVKLQP